MSRKSPASRSIQRAEASPEELVRLPYMHEFDPNSQEYQIMHKLPRKSVPSGAERGA